MFTKRIRQFGKWLGQAWPLWTILLLVVTNTFLFHKLHYDRSSVHRTAGALLQIVGGSFVLFSLNKNMGVFNQGTLRERVSRWWRSRPFRNRAGIAIHTLEPGHFEVKGSDVRLIHQKIGIEERLQELEKRVEELYKEMKSGEDSLRQATGTVGEELRSALSEERIKITKIETLLETTAVGSVNFQFFGILVVCYGTALPLF